MNCVMERKGKGTRGWVGRLQELYAVVKQEPFLASEEWSLILVNFYVQQYKCDNQLQRETTDEGEGG